jgi:hypothetical protein
MPYRFDKICATPIRGSERKHGRGSLKYKGPWSILINGKELQYLVRNRIVTGSSSLWTAEQFVAMRFGIGLNPRCI